MNMYYLFDNDGKCNCKICYTRKTEHVKELFHPVYYIIVYNEKQDILLKRKYIKDKPLKWNFAITGQPNTTAKLRDCLKALPFEEIGTFIDLSRFDYAGDIKNTCHGEWCTIIFAYDNHTSDYYFSDIKSVYEYGWATLNELIELMDSNEFTTHSEEFKEGIIRMIRNKFTELNTRQRFIPLG